jgi:ribokinase
MHLLVFGSINLDLALSVPHPPTAGETVLGSGLRLSPGGKGANQAHAARLHGAHVQMVGRVGRDALGPQALALLGEAGVELSGVVRDANHATGLATVMVLPGGDNAIVVGPGANAALSAADATEAAVLGARGLLLQMEVPALESMAVARRVRAAGGWVMLNLAPAHDIHLIEPELIDWLVVNQHELQTVCAFMQLAAGPTAAQAKALAAAWQCTTVVTLGAQGAVACTAAGEILRVEAPATQVCDTTGAGDTFCGVLAAAWFETSDTAAALRTASTAASLACRKPGAQAAQPHRKETDDALARR